MLTGVELIAEERERQIQEKGYTAEHDKGHTRGELAAAAISYAAEAIDFGRPSGCSVPLLWPWAPSLWRPEDSQLENLIKAGAFLAAEIDRLQADTLRRAGVAE